MNKILVRILFVSVSLILLTGWAKGQEASETYRSIVTNFKNNPLPKNPASLKILGIGNSFTVDGMEYLPDLLKHAGITNVTLGKLILGGCSLERHYQIYTSGDSAYSYAKSYPGKNTWEEVKKPCTFRHAVADEDWDIIVIQQVSGNSGLYDTYQPYLNHLIDAMVVNCKNAGVCLAWQMTWAYGQDSNHKDFVKYGNNQTTMYHAILNAVKSMVAETGIDIVIPSATAIQSIRNTKVNNPPLDFTRDGYHIDLGAGRYLLACTWFQTLIAPCFKTTIAGNSFRVNNGNVSVTDEFAALCQKAAQYACAKRFEISLISQ